MRWLFVSVCRTETELPGTQIDKPQILVSEFLRSHDVRRDGKDDLVFVSVLVFLGEEVLRIGNVSSSG
jgi:hypothetical protein